MLFLRCAIPAPRPDYTLQDWWVDTLQVSLSNYRLQFYNAPAQ